MPRRRTSAATIGLDRPRPTRRARQRSPPTPTHRSRSVLRPAGSRSGCRRCGRRARTWPVYRRCPAAGDRACARGSPAPAGRPRRAPRRPRPAARCPARRGWVAAAAWTTPVAGGSRTAGRCRQDLLRSPVRRPRRTSRRLELADAHRAAGIERVIRKLLEHQLRQQVDGHAGLLAQRRERAEQRPVRALECKFWRFRARRTACRDARSIWRILQSAPRKC